MVKKRYLLTLSVLILFAFVFSVYQYVGTMRTEIASAANTKPNPGHSWSEMESDSDSIQVNGQIITNLAVPVNDTDAVNKAYVDAAGVSPLYDTCYLIVSPTAGLNCDSSYTTLLSNTGSSTWTGGGPFAFSGISGATFGVSTGNVTYGAGFCLDCNIEGYPNYANFGQTPNALCSALPSRCFPRIFVNDQVFSNCVSYSTAQTLKLCCK